MANKLEIIKQLRAKGATIRIIDDVAAYLTANGGYNSPVLVATVEFIIKIREMLQSMLVQQERTVSIADKFTEKDTQDVSFPAAKHGVENNDEIEEYEKEQILDHIVEIEAQQNVYLENNNYKQRQNSEIDAQGNKGQKKRETKRNGILDKLFKISMLNSQKDKQQKNQQAPPQENGQQQAAQQNMRQQNAGQQQQAVQSGSITRMNIVRMKLMSALKVTKDRTVVGDVAKQAWKDSKKIDQSPQQKQGEELTAAKDKRTVNEISFSKVIDEAVKAPRQEKKTLEEKPPAEKGKFEKKAGEKTGPRADEAKVAEMAAKDAIKMLKNNGVTTDAPDMKTKKEIDAQITQIQTAANGGATPKLQR